MLSGLNAPCVLFAVHKLFLFSHIRSTVPSVSEHRAHMHCTELTVTSLIFCCCALLYISYTTSSNQQNQSPCTQSQRRRVAICSKWHSMSLCKCFQNRESKASHLFLISFSIQGKAFGVMRWRQLVISIFSLSSAHVSLPHPPHPRSWAPTLDVHLFHAPVQFRCTCSW